MNTTPTYRPTTYLRHSFVSATATQSAHWLAWVNGGRDNGLSATGTTKAEAVANLLAARNSKRCAGR